ncbi:MAG TPA: hypothetical protein GXX51_06350 [Firmicutes bacterium]|nr:hypothetical protein [Bacillota bacterium]
MRNKAALALETMLQKHEAEYALANTTLEFVPVVCIMVGGMLELAKKLFGNLTVLDAHMKRNLEADGGFGPTPFWSTPGSL